MPADPNDPNRPEITFWKPLRPDLDPPVWCDGSAFQYPVNRHDHPTPEHENLPFTFEAYKQIVETHVAIVPESSITIPTAPKVWMKSDIVDLKTAIETDQYEMEWAIAKDDAKFWHEDEVNDLRRASAYPNTTDEQNYDEIAGVAEWTFKWCSGQAKNGARWLAESGDGEGSPSGWQSYVNQKLAEPGQTHRFWMWTRYFDSGIWEFATVGPIGVDGTILEPFGGTEEGSDDDEWVLTPQTGGGTNLGIWQLLQLIQDIEPVVENLSTAYHPIKGTLFDTEHTDTWTSSNSSQYGSMLLSPDDGAGCPYMSPWEPHNWMMCGIWWEGGWSSSSSYTNGCSGYTSYSYDSGSGCTCSYPGPNGSSGNSGSVFNAAWEWDIEFGATFFQTWEYYIDAIFGS
jgi:hypothetical protein